ncbi:hypothetical protein [Metabacillus litoralis]|uniref:hypothetical protein n=1 Tax=Metabacillus litoralis TaxID=152268 RepID=UPI001CFCDD76|nr:hypothetical protein [Metabacillus litoralis]
MKELTFKSYNQFQQFIEHKAMEKAVMKELHNEELSLFIKEFIDRSNRMWQENDCDKAIEKDGFVVIRVWKDEIGRRKVGRGRPKKPDSEKYNHSIHVRLDEQTYSTLTHFCKENNLEVSEAIRDMIKKLS